VPDKLKPGMRVNRHVRLVRPLRSGAMGSLWVGEHLNLDTQVAVKFIAEEARFENPDSARRFEVEAKAAAQIRSPHVVQIFDHGISESGFPYIVMELLEGESLAERLERTGWLTFRQAGEVIRQVAAGLAKAHDAGIIHRDVKPDNIFLCEADEGFSVKLLDFGVAKSIKGMDPGTTVPGAMVGTAEYLSREQVVSAKAVDAQADLWSLAVVAYEMLTGDVPFAGETLGLICIAICNGSFTPPSELRKSVPAALDAWFDRAFEADPRDRFPSARAMAEAFLLALRASHDSLTVNDDEPSLAGSLRPTSARPRNTRSVGTAVGLGPSTSRLAQSSPAPASSLPPTSGPPPGVSSEPPRPSTAEGDDGPSDNRLATALDDASGDSAPIDASHIPGLDSRRRRRSLLLLAAAIALVLGALLLMPREVPPVGIIDLDLTTPSVPLPTAEPTPEEPLAEDERLVGPAAAGPPRPPMPEKSAVPQGPPENLDEDRFDARSDYGF
jgi:eukaryotic-like serine/threonine-protein kinase